MGIKEGQREGGKGAGVGGGRSGISRKGMLRWGRRRRGKGSWKLGSPIVAVKRSLGLGSL